VFKIKERERESKNDNNKTSNWKNSRQ
jgi:hypothetical protein